jgi:hypothetical protein
VADIAFGFVIEKFDLLLPTLLDAASLDASRRAQLEKLSGPSTRYEGLALISVGTVLVVAAVRFVRTERSLASSPARCRRASVTTSRRFVLIRSPARFGISAGATIIQSWPSACTWR